MEQAHGGACRHPLDFDLGWCNGMCRNDSAVDRAVANCAERRQVPGKDIVLDDVHGCGLVGCIHCRIESELGPNSRLPRCASYPSSSFWKPDCEAIYRARPQQGPWKPSGEFEVVTIRIVEDCIRRKSVTSDVPPYTKLAGHEINDRTSPSARRQCCYRQSLIVRSVPIVKQTVQPNPYEEPSTTTVQVNMRAHDRVPRIPRPRKSPVNGRQLGHAAQAHRSPIHNPSFKLSRPRLTLCSVVIDFEQLRGLRGGAWCTCSKTCSVASAYETSLSPSFGRQPGRRVTTSRHGS